MHDPQTEVNVEGYYEGHCTNCGTDFAGMVEGTGAGDTATIWFSCPECNKINDRTVAKPPVERPFI